MNEWFHPSFIFIMGAFLVPFLKGGIRRVYLLLLPSLAFLLVLSMPEGDYFAYRFLGNNLVFVHVDRLSLLFAYAFIIIQFVGMMYSLHLKDSRQHMAALFYGGSSLGAVFAGDYLTLFIFWEIMAFASAYLVFSGGAKNSVGAGFRYILVHIFGGIALFSGIALHYGGGGSLALGPIKEGTAFYLILTGFLLNAAAPPLSAWLPDAYPEATVTGAVFLSAFTTKTAVYALARAFAGTELLFYLGIGMALYGIIYVMMENDIRRLLSYHIISQVGYMVAGVGMGGGLALNGATAHAFTNIIYKGLLFMGAGAVIHTTGLRKLSEAGGLLRAMPITFALYMIGGLSISAMPLFSGFVSKSMVVGAAISSHRGVAALLLTLVSTGTFLSTTLKLPYYVFFGKEREMEPEGRKEAPFNMLLAMGIAAFLCIAIGIFPRLLYSILPYPVDFEPYTSAHITGSLGLLLFTALAFFVLLRKLKPEARINIDTDWFYRKGAGLFMWFVCNPLTRFNEALGRAVSGSIPSFLAHVSRNPLATLNIAEDSLLLSISPGTKRAEIKERIKRKRSIYPADVIKRWPIGTAVLWVALFLLASLVVYYF
ncbi:MAG: Na(+)/H(+) antiporter subunit D [Deltaproteobacteria bacterium]|nr:Na(+)/H(+) antiporter subunit D [Deltaproteobacteria bacterium]